MSAIDDPAARAVTAVAGLLLIAALALGLGDGGATLPLALLGAGTVLGLFVLVPRGYARIRRQPVLLLGAVIAAVPFVLVVFFGYLGNSSLFWNLREIGVALTPLAIIGLAALGGLILIADDLRTRFGLAQRGLTPWQRLTGTTDVPVPAPWRALGGLALIGLGLILGLGYIGASGSGGLMSLALLLVLGGGARSADLPWWAWPSSSGWATSGPEAAGSCPWSCCSCWAAARRPSSPCPSSSRGWPARTARD